MYIRKKRCRKHLQFKFDECFEDEALQSGCYIYDIFKDWNGFEDEAYKKLEYE